jgi:hypothetical protein
MTARAGCKILRRRSIRATPQGSSARRYLSLNGTERLRGRSALFGVLQNDASPLIIDERPFLYLLQGAKAAKAGRVII